MFRVLGWFRGEFFFLASRSNKKKHKRRTGTLYYNSLLCFLLAFLVFGCFVPASGWKEGGALCLVSLIVGFDFSSVF